MATTRSKLDVFICHAGEEKQDFVDYLYTHLKEIHGLSVFVDEHSLKVANHARIQMEEKLDAATVGVFIYSSRHFLIFMQNLDKP